MEANNTKMMQMYISSRQHNEIMNILDDSELKSEDHYHGHQPESKFIWITIKTDPVENFNFIPQLDKLYKTSYFHGILSLKNLQQILDTCKDNCYLLSLPILEEKESFKRKSDNNLVRLSYKYNGQVSHMYVFNGSISNSVGAHELNYDDLSTKHQKITDWSERWKKWNDENQFTAKDRRMGINFKNKQFMDSQFTKNELKQARCEITHLSELDLEKPIYRNKPHNLTELTMVKIASTLKYEKLNYLQIPNKLKEKFKTLGVVGKYSNKVFCQGILPPLSHLSQIQNKW